VRSADLGLQAEIEDLYLAVGEGMASPTAAWSASRRSASGAASSNAIAWRRPTPSTPRRSPWTQMGASQQRAQTLLGEDSGLVRVADLGNVRRQTLAVGQGRGPRGRSRRGCARRGWPTQRRRRRRRRGPVSASRSRYAKKARSADAQSPGVAYQRIEHRLESSVDERSRSSSKTHAERLGHAVEGCGQIPQFVLTLDRDSPIEVSPGDGFCASRQRLDRAGELADMDPDPEESSDQRERPDPEDCVSRLPQDAQLVFEGYPIRATARRSFRSRTGAAKIVKGLSRIRAHL